MAIVVNPTEVSKKKLASKTKYTCPDCGLNAWAKPDCTLVCAECQSAMTSSVEREELAREDHVAPSQFDGLFDLMAKARDAILAGEKFGRKRKAKRLESGQHLLDLKTMIESDPELLNEHGSWVEWLDYWMRGICSRKDAEKRMVLALGP